jgi:hypothetical protein
VSRPFASGPRDAIASSELRRNVASIFGARPAYPYKSPELVLPDFHYPEGVVNHQYGKRMTSMNSRQSGIARCLLLGVLLAGGQAIAQEQASAGGHQAMHHVPQMDAGTPGKKGCKHHGKGAHAGKQHRAGKGHPGTGKGAKRLYGEHWKHSLTAEQKAELDRLHLEYARTKAPLKAGVKAMKVRLAVLATSGSATQDDMNGPIMDLLLAKQEMVRAKYNYIAAQRNVLNPEQRVSFDMEVIHKAMHGSKGGHGKH